MNTVTKWQATRVFIPSKPYYTWAVQEALAQCEQVYGGLTVTQGEGRWQGIREPVNIVEILHDVDASYYAITKLVVAIKEQGEEEVLFTTHPLSVTFVK